MLLIYINIHKPCFLYGHVFCFFNLGAHARVNNNALARHILTKFESPTSKPNSDKEGAGLHNENVSMSPSTPRWRLQTDELGSSKCLFNDTLTIVSFMIFVSVKTL